MTCRSIASIMNVFQSVSSMPAEQEPSGSLHSSKVLQTLHPSASLPTLREKPQCSSDSQPCSEVVAVLNCPRCFCGFAVKFYTQEGNWDIVGNNIPVFFIQDAIKFPDIIHAGKPEPHNEVPQAQATHNNFWDFQIMVGYTV